jgi:hypothetical protein
MNFTDPTQLVPEVLMHFQFELVSLTPRPDFTQYQTVSVKSGRSDLSGSCILPQEQKKFSEASRASVYF